MNAITTLTLSHLQTTFKKMAALLEQLEEGELVLVTFQTSNRWYKKVNLERVGDDFLIVKDGESLDVIEMVNIVGAIYYEFVPRKPIFVELEPASYALAE